MIRVGLLSPSPIPFRVPLYRRLTQLEEIDLSVMYACSMGVRPATAGYSANVVWDTDLLAGYHSGFLQAAGRTAPVGASSLELVDFDVISWLRREQFDVLWTDGYSWLTNQMAILTQRALGGGVVLRDEQTMLHPRGFLKTVAKEVIVRVLFAAVDAGAYISRENRRFLEHYGLQSEQLFWCPYGPDSELFAAQAAQLRPRRSELRARFGFSDDAGPIVMSISRLAPMKQPQMLLEAFRLVRSRHRCCLLVVGSGPLEAELKETVAREKIPDVNFAGFLNQSEVAHAYAASDVFALLSGWNETFGVAVAEAMYFSLPLVLSDKVGSAPDLLADEVNGILVPHDDVDAAEAALARLIEDAALRDQFGTSSRDRIAKRGLDQATEGALRAIRHAAACRGERARR